MHQIRNLILQIQSLYLGTQEQLKIDPWRASQPNDKKQLPYCVKAYLGN